MTGLVMVRVLMMGQVSLLAVVAVQNQKETTLELAERLTEHSPDAWLDWPAINTTANSNFVLHTRHTTNNDHMFTTPSDEAEGCYGTRLSNPAAAFRLPMVHSGSDGLEG